MASQKRQLEMGVKVAPDLIAMVKRFHQRWNELKQFITDRRTGIEKGLQKYDMETLGIACEFSSGSILYTSRSNILSFHVTNIRPGWENVKRNRDGSP